MKEGLAIEEEELEGGGEVAEGGGLTMEPCWELPPLGRASSGWAVGSMGSSLCKWLSSYNMTGSW